MERIKKLISYINEFANCTVEDNIGMYAAQASFFLIISAIPFMMLMLAVLQFIIPFSESDIIHLINQYMPSKIVPWVEDITNEIFNNSSNISIISVTAVSALWLASRGFMALYTGLNNVAGVKKLPNYFYSRIIAVVYTICFLALMIFAFVLFGAGKRLSEMLEEKSFIFSDILMFLMDMRIVVGLILLTLCFSLFYTFLPNEKMRIQRQIPGAFLASAGWMGFSYAYSIYIEYFSNYSYVYGSLTAIVFLMFWLYFCMDIFLFGAEFNKIAQKRLFK